MDPDIRGINDKTGFDINDFRGDRYNQTEIRNINDDNNPRYESMVSDVVEYGYLVFISSIRSLNSDSYSRMVVPALITNKCRRYVWYSLRYERYEYPDRPRLKTKRMSDSV